MWCPQILQPSISLATVEGGSSLRLPTYPVLKNVLRRFCSTFSIFAKSISPSFFSLPFVSRDDTIVTERIWEAPSDETPRTKTLENKRFHLEKTFLKNYEKEKSFACVCVVLCVCSGVRAFVGSGNLSVRMRLRAPVFVSVNNCCS